MLPTSTYTAAEVIGSVLSCSILSAVSTDRVFVSASSFSPCPLVYAVPPPPVCLTSFIAATRLLLSSVVRSARLPMSARSCSSTVGGVAGKGLPSVPPVGATLICATFVVMRGLTSPSRAELPTSHTRQSPAVRLSCCLAVISPPVTGTSYTVQPCPNMALISRPVQSSVSHPTFAVRYCTDSAARGRYSAVKDWWLAVKVML